MTSYTHYTTSSVGASAEQREMQERGAQPATCRMRQQREGKPYPKSGCQHCCDGGLFGCPFEKDRSATHDADGRRKPELQPASVSRPFCPDISAIEARARAATPGKWWKSYGRNYYEVRADSGSNLAERLKLEDAAHIAGLSPDVVLALCVHVRQVEDERDALCRAATLANQQKNALCARYRRMEETLQRISKATPANTNSRTAENMRTWCKAVAETALEDVGADR